MLWSDKCRGVARTTINIQDGVFATLINSFLSYISDYIYSSSLHLWNALRKRCLYLELFWSAFFPHFLAFGLNTERYGVSFRIQSECGKIREKCGPKTPNTDTFYAVMLYKDVTSNKKVRPKKSYSWFRKLASEKIFITHPLA